MMAGWFLPVVDPRVVVAAPNLAVVADILLAVVGILLLAVVGILLAVEAVVVLRRPLVPHNSSRTWPRG